METIKKAIEFHKTGQYEAAKEKYLEYLSQNPNKAEAHHLLGLLLLQMDNLELAFKHLEISTNTSKDAIFEGDLALCCYLMKDYNKAIVHFKNSLAIEINKTYLEKALELAEKLGNASYILFFSEMYYKLEPDNINLLRKLPDLAKNTQNTDLAIYYLNLCIEKFNNDHIAYNNIGLLYEEKGDFDSAKKSYEKSLMILPNYHSYFNLGVLNRRMRDFDNSERNLKYALDFNLDSKDVRYALSTTYLIKENFKKGYPLYLNHIHTSLSFIKNFWNGSYQPELNLAIYAFGGFGDIFMYTRYIKYVKDKFKNITLIVPKELLELYTYNFPQYNITTQLCEERDWLATTFQDIANYYNKDFNNIPDSKGYLTADKKLTKIFKKKFFDNDKYKVGFFYSGNNFNRRSMKNRSIAIEMLSVVFDQSVTVDKIKYYSIQKDADLNEFNKYKNVVSLSPYINSFSDTAAIIENLDLLITIDSAPLHLAGAMGKKTILMLPYGSEWRWFKDEEQTRWYKSVKIFKQEKECDWREVVDKINKFLFSI